MRYPRLWLLARQGRLIRSLCVAWVLTASGCKFDQTTVAAGREQLVVHAVLDPGRVAHRVLLERVLTGRVAVPADVPFDSLNPIASRGGLPVRDAVVIVFGAGGDSAVATERPTSTGVGTGVYEFFNRADAASDGPNSPSVPVLRGGTYRLHITTSAGEVLSASTTVPDAASTPRSASLETFNRDHDSRFLFWDDIPGAERYEIVVGSPMGAYAMFVDSLEFLVDGRLQHTTLRDAGDVFMPGFSQEVTAAAVDRNYFDYFRSHNDHFTGRGLLDHVEGGTGVFGSVVLLRVSRLRVTADVDNAIEGQYRLTSGAGPAVINLFIAAASPAETRVSGNYPAAGSQFPGVLGTVRGDSVSLALLRGQSARDTSMVLDGWLDGNMLRGRFRGIAGDVVYRREDRP